MLFERFFKVCVNAESSSACTEDLKDWSLAVKYSEDPDPDPERSSGNKGSSV